MKNTLVIMGNIGSPYGINGWVKVNSFALPRKNLFYYSWLLNHVNDGWKPIEIEKFCIHAGSFIVKVLGIIDREQAKSMTNCTIGVSRNELPKLSDNQFYWTDLIGMQVFNQNNINLGKVIDIFSTGANDVLVIKGTKEYLVPLVINDYIEKIDLDNMQMNIYWDQSF